MKNDLEFLHIGAYCTELFGVETDSLPEHFVRVVLLGLAGEGGYSFSLPVASFYFPYPKRGSSWLKVELSTQKRLRLRAWEEINFFINFSNATSYQSCNHKKKSDID